MRVAIVHDWLTNYGGAERVVQALLELYPDADIFTLVYNRKNMEARFPPEKVHTSFMQGIPFSTRLYTKMLALMPRAFESFDFSDYDLVISSSSSCAKGVITPPSVPHIAYIHSPMRYAWDLYFTYRRRSGVLTRFFMDRWMPGIRLWDYVSSQRIDMLVANSRYIARRISKFWNRQASVIYPPVDTARLGPNGLPPEDFYVAFSRLVPYKRMDLAVSACMQAGRRLIVIGSGSQERRLRALAASDRNITFTGRLSDSETKSLLQRCRALIFCAEEDFGIIPVEAQACGRPVIALGRGGALETVLDGKTGVLFQQQSSDALLIAMERFERLEAQGTFRAERIAAHASQFSAEIFKKKFSHAADTLLKGAKT